MRNRTPVPEDNISVVSDFRELNRVRDYVIEKALLYGFDEDVAYNISLAVDEACSNIIRHAYNKDKRRRITLAIESEGKKFTVRIYDNGYPFNPLEVPKQDMNKYMKNFKKGGLGVHIMRSVMDDISYFPSDKYNTHNLLLLHKYNK